MQKKFINVATLALLQLVIIGNLQILPSTAIYGFSLPFLYLIAIICFFVPCVVMTMQLAIKYPQTGGAYIWTEHAFGLRMGFLTVAILWISNLLWYPSIFALIAANFAYLFDVSLAQNKFFVVCFSLILFWAITLLNCIGVRISTRVSAWCSVFGIIIPMIVIILCGVTWWLLGKPFATTTTLTPFIPDLKNFNNFGYLIAVVISLFGIEITAVHAGDVINPQRNYPFSLIISSILFVILSLFAALAIAIIIPAANINIETGLLDALVFFFKEIKFSALLLIVLALVFVGNVGSIAAWMLGSTRGMYVACKKNHVSPFLQKTNRHESPVGVLIIEAIIFTCASMVFLLFPKIVDSFWLLLVLASQISLIYYIILFFTAKRLQCSPFLMFLGIFTSIIALIMGFIPPPNLSGNEIFMFHIILVFGLLFAIILPLIFLKIEKR